MNEIIVENALIKSTMLGTEDHGIMSFWLNLEYNGGGQQAGGYCLDTMEHDAKGVFKRRIGWGPGLGIIMRILEVVGVSKWEDLPGKYIRVKHDWDKVYEIGNITKDEWLNFVEFFRKEKEGAYV